LRTSFAVICETLAARFGRLAGREGLRCRLL